MQHAMQLAIIKTGGEHGAVAYCWCGWASEANYTVLAIQDWRLHKRYVEHRDSDLYFPYNYDYEDWLPGFDYVEALGDSAID